MCGMCAVCFAHAPYSKWALCSAFYLFLINKFTHEVNNNNNNNNDIRRRGSDGKKNTERTALFSGWTEERECQDLRECIVRSKNAREPQRRPRQQQQHRVFSLSTVALAHTHTHMQALARVQRQAMRAHRPRGLFLHVGSVERTIYAPWPPCLWWFGRVQYLCEHAA